MDSFVHDDIHSKSNINIESIIANEDILQNIIETTLQKQHEKKFEKQFYESLKPSQEELASFAYK